MKVLNKYGLRIVYKFVVKQGYKIKIIDKNIYLMSGIGTYYMWDKWTWRSINPYFLESTK